MKTTRLIMILGAFIVCGLFVTAIQSRITDTGSFIDGGVNTTQGNFTDVLANRVNVYFNLSCDNQANDGIPCLIATGSNNLLELVAHNRSARPGIGVWSPGGSASGWQYIRWVTHELSDAGVYHNHSSIYSANSTNMTGSFTNRSGAEKRINIEFGAPVVDIELRNVELDLLDVPIKDAKWIEIQGTDETETLLFVDGNTNSTGRGPYFYTDTGNETNNDFFEVECDNPLFNESCGIFQSDQTAGTPFLFDIDGTTQTYGVRIDSEQTTGYGFYMDTAGAGALIQTDSSNWIAFAAEDSADGTVYVKRDDTSATTQAPVVTVLQDNAGDDQIALYVQNDGTGHAIETRGSMNVSTNATIDGITICDRVSGTPYFGKNASWCAT